MLMNQTVNSKGSPIDCGNYFKYCLISILCGCVSQHSVVDDAVSEAVCIIADTDKWCVFNIKLILLLKVFLTFCLMNYLIDTYVNVRV